ncbi:bifunctional phosphopantothenoylcysteine decarboxylase/phosphopantothenate--cysteine ligase CoaBC [Neptunitalea lumnitzerae]|uniref:Coenzyme A biosynthesis bifunctional protein CoaBC n=1 Tax=Neptunitalea lumnitzerae TaxID=2965509 RepID=A0ABQ5MK15_9FLAO|nr:bifunctional phosphopantothenoylcysteine decarboxylase/phosphopantothenate--cysteine ligase CoaBC [Neptunitalea sp. Y10]GLB49744.1 phosphopantothenoylcysteine decarboxylase [Neptunitalea sp. Y10]
MSVLSGKKILLGVTGGIAAYKTTYLVRLFIKAGAQVQVVMTNNAKEFVTPLVLSTLSKNPVLSDFVKDTTTGEWANHVDLGLWADFMVVAPATINTLAKMATGESDNLLLAVYRSAKCPVYFAPAMDLDMYKHESTQHTFKVLQSFGNIMIPSEAGELASGLVGEGRMAEPENICTFIENDILGKAPLNGKKVLITAGPTYEAIDPVRFIGNHSSGKMGYALAEVANSLGAQVTLVSGPTSLKDPLDVNVVRVVSAEEMYSAVHEYYATTDIAICAAAVADYRPKNVAEQKIKKQTASLTIELEPTKDILASLGASKQNQFLVGFALETENELANAKGKLERKNLDAIVLNSLNDTGAGFGKPTNKVTFINHKEVKAFSIKEKGEVAKDIFNEIIERLDA